MSSLLLQSDLSDQGVQLIHSPYWAVLTNEGHHISRNRTRSAFNVHGPSEGALRIGMVRICPTTIFPTSSRLLYVTKPAGQHWGLVTAKGGESASTVGGSGDAVGIGCRSSPGIN